jgi:hypothetical protein
VLASSQDKVPSLAELLLDEFASLDAALLTEDAASEDALDSVADELTSAALDWLDAGLLIEELTSDVALLATALDTWLTEELLTTAEDELPPELPEPPPQAARKLLNAASTISWFVFMVDALSLSLLGFIVVKHS